MIWDDGFAFGFFVHACESAEASDREEPPRPEHIIFCAVLEDNRPHAKSELVDLNAEKFCGDVVAVFVDDDADGYNDYES